MLTSPERKRKVKKVRREEGRKGKKKQRKKERKEKAKLVVVKLENQLRFENQVGHRSSERNFSLNTALRDEERPRARRVSSTFCVGQQPVKLATGEVVRTGRKKRGK